MHPKKKFGQNFLKDKKILGDLINLINVSPTNQILEIGPGKGDFSDFIINLCNSYYGIEIDEDLLALLKKKFPEKKDFFINCDFLKFDPKEIFGLGRFRLVGNIPYNISSPILGWCENHYEQIEDMHFMLQKEFALRCSGTEKTSSYGRLSVICNYLYEVEILKDVEREYFEPKPKVDSLFVRFLPKMKEIDNEQFKNLKRVTRVLFNKKRKKISNSLKDVIKKEDFSDLNVDLNLRPDELSLSEYIRLSNKLKDYA